MKIVKLFVCLAMFSVLFGCGDNTSDEKDSSLEYVVSQMFSTENESHLTALKDAKSNDEVLDEIEKVYKDYVTSDMFTLLPTQLLSFQNRAFTLHKNMRVDTYKENKKDDYIEVSITLKIDDDSVDVKLDAQMDGNKVSSIKLIDFQDLDKALSE